MRPRWFCRTTSPSFSDRTLAAVRRLSSARRDVRCGRRWVTTAARFLFFFGATQQSVESSVFVGTRRTEAQCAGSLDRWWSREAGAGERSAMKSAYWTLLVVLAAIPATAQVAVNDLFNRANSGSLGSDWTEQDGDATIVANQLQANSAFTFGWCSHKSFSASYSSVVLRASFTMSGSGGAVSLITGVDPSTWNGVEVRISDNNGDGQADRIFFNAAVNAGAWYTSASWQDMSAPMASGEMTTWFTDGGNTVNVALRDPATGSVQAYSASGILANPPTGTQVGIGYRGTCFVDDFRAWVGTPTQPVYTLTAIHAGAPTTLLVSDTIPYTTIAVAYSTESLGPIPTIFGVLGLAGQIEILFEAQTDAAG